MFRLMKSHHQADIHYKLILKLLNCYLHGYMLQYYNYVNEILKVVVL
jgi:hypothetical protein